MIEKRSEDMTDVELEAELERLHKVLSDGQEARLNSHEIPDEASNKEHWEAWDRMFGLFKEQWNRKHVTEQ